MRNSCSDLLYPVQTCPWLIVFHCLLLLHWQQMDGATWWLKIWFHFFWDLLKDLVTCIPNSSLHCPYSLQMFGEVVTPEVVGHLLIPYSLRSCGFTPGCSRARYWNFFLMCSMVDRKHLTVEKSVWVGERGIVIGQCGLCGLVFYVISVLASGWLAGFAPCWGAIALGWEFQLFFFSLLKL